MVIEHNIKILSRGKVPYNSTRVLAEQLAKNLIVKLHAALPHLTLIDWLFLF